jgi:MFS family permease
LNTVFGSAALLGFGCIWATVSYSVILARHYPAKRQSMFSIISLSETTAAILQPIAFGVWFTRVESGIAHSLLAVFLGLAAIPALGMLMVFLTWKTAPLVSLNQRIAATPAESRSLTSPHRVLFSGAIWLIGVCVLMHGIYQIGYVSWIGPYDAGKLGITTAKAAMLLSVNNIGFWGGRALLGWLCARVKIPDLILLGAASGLGSLAIAFGLMTSDYRLALALCFLEGFFVAGDSPAMSSFVGGRFINNAGLAYALYGGFGQVGGAVGGYLIGILARLWNSVQRAIWTVPSISVVLSLLAFTWQLLDERSKRTAKGTIAKVNQV